MCLPLCVVTPRTTSSYSSFLRVLPILYAMMGTSTMSRSYFLLAPSVGVATLVMASHSTSADDMVNSAGQQLTPTGAILSMWVPPIL